MKAYKHITMITWMILLVTFMNLDSQVFAFDDQGSRLSLRGLKGIHVMVEPLSHEIERDGLRKCKLINHRFFVDKYKILCIIIT